MLLRTQG